MKYTADQVQLAWAASDVDAIATTEGTSAKNIVFGFANDDEQGQAEWADYLAGKEVLRTAKIIMTANRYDCTIHIGFETYGNKLIKRGIDSPVVEVLAGYVATSQMCRVIALKERE